MSDTDIQQTSLNQDEDFYDLAARFVEETSTSEQPHRLLKMWAHRFPDYAADFAALAYARLAEPKAGLAGSSPLNEDAIVKSAQRVLDRFVQSNPPLTSLTEAASSVGISAKLLAERLRVDLPLIAKLEQRLLIARSIPGALISRLAQEIGRTTSDVRAYLSMPSRLAIDADYNSKRPPSLDKSSPQTFAEALATSRMMTSEDKTYWLNHLGSNENE